MISVTFSQHLSQIHMHPPLSFKSLLREVHTQTPNLPYSCPDDQQHQISGCGQGNSHTHRPQLRQVHLTLLRSQTLICGSAYDTAHPFHSGVKL